MKLNIRNWLRDKYPKNHDKKQLHPTIAVDLYHRIITDLEIKSLTIFDICTLVEVLELPLILACAEIRIITQVTESLLLNFSQKKVLKRNEGTWLGFQIAYLRGLQQILEQEVNLQKPWINRAIFWHQENENNFLLADSHLEELLKTFRTSNFTDTQAEHALSLVANSSFVQQIDRATNAWFIANGVQETEAKLIVQRIANGLNGHLLAVIAENPLPLVQLQKFVRLGIVTPANNAAANKINLQRELYRASLLQHQAKTLFIESFSLKDIYVPLKGLPIEPINSSEQKTFQFVDLMVCVLQELNDLESITAIESEAGYGKTSFCQILAAKLAQEFYPNLMPVLIRLRDVNYSEDLIAMLNSGLKSQIHLSEWLKIEHPKLVLILDGLDELPFNRNSMGKAKFIEHLLKLQSNTRHKIVLTSRSQELHDEIQLRRIVIQPFEQEELRIWFQNWATLQSIPIAQNLFTFLKQAGLFSTKSIPELATLVRQPLMLYLLAILHRDGFFDNEILELAANSQQTGNAALLWEIYQRLNQIQSQNLLAEIPKIALLILHSQRYYIESNMFLNTCRLNIVEGLETGFLISPEPSRTDRLTAFYFHSLNTDNKPLTKIEFSHAKLGEFITAEAIVTELKLLTQYQRNSYGEYIFTIESITNVAQHLYKLLGFGILTEEIEKLVISGLRQAKTREFSFERLCDRLLQFWYPYCHGRWLDEGIAHKAWDYFQTLHNYNNVEQINAAVGLNLFFLLSACHRQAKRSFYPCHNPSNWEEFQPDLLLILINRSAILAPQVFQKRINSKSFATVNLSDANLTQVVLTQVNLEGVNLSGANLAGANLAGANLTRANLTGANLSNINLTGVNLANANLTGVNLTNANLTGANLQSAILTNACLHNAILTESNKETAKVQGAIFVLEEWVALKLLLLRYHQKLLPASHNPNSLDSTGNTDIWFCDIPQVGLIESIEGEVLTEDLYEDEADDETVSF